MKTKVYLRADGNSQMGLGHVIRSLALAEMLNGTFQCIYLTKNLASGLVQLIEKTGIETIPLPTSKNILEEAKFITEKYLSSKDIIVLDGYHFGTDYQEIIKGSQAKLVCIDDIFAQPFLADVIINHAGGITPHDYQGTAFTQYFLGIPYALLRKPFRQAAEGRAKFSENTGLFICLGGADPQNDTLGVLKVLEEKEIAQPIFVITGNAYLHLEALNDFGLKTSLQLQFLQNLSAEEMVATMQKTSIGIVSPSTIALEYLSVGGDLYLKIIADNQHDVFKYLVSSGLAFDFKDFKNIDQSKLESAKALKQSVLDGKSQERFLKIFKQLEAEIKLQIRQAFSSDLLTYFDWTNEEGVRANSINSEPIALDDHKVWFSHKINNADTRMFLLGTPTKLIGQVRFEIKGNTATINYSIDKNARGQGWSKPLLKKAMQELCFQKPTISRIEGVVKISNIASLKVFEGLNFQMAEVYELNREKYKRFYLNI